MQAVRVVTFVAAVLLGSAWTVSAQNAQLSGRITDSSGAIVVNASVTLISKGKAIKHTVRSNAEGMYFLPSVGPDAYVVQVQATGFQPTVRDNLILNVDERAQLDFTLHVGGVTQEVTVKGGAQSPLLGRASGTLSTVIDRELAENLPVRGRSFSALVALAPGVAVVTGDNGDGSGFSVNGQRETANALTVDGVSAPSEMGSQGISNAAGQRFSTTVTGTVNGGVSMDAVQEIRVQTSSFAAEFGRTPGAQISLVTRSGTNRFSGSLFEQFRNDTLMANDWFANSRGVGKPSIEEHQFGATLGGPLVPSRFFFFASYEGLRLSQPHFEINDVPSVEARQADSLIRDVLNAYPLPTGPSRPDMTAEYAAYHALRHESDTFGLRLDYASTKGTQVFTRYSQVPSAREASGLGSSTTIQRSRNVTGGWTATLGTRALIELRANYSETIYESVAGSDLAAWLPEDVETTFAVFSVPSLSPLYTSYSDNVQRENNVVASLSYQFGQHLFKVGTDYHHLRPMEHGQHWISASFLRGLPEALAASSVDQLGVSHKSQLGATFQNLSIYAQDTWTAAPRLSLMYGLRWDVNPAPSFPPNEGPLATVTYSPISQLNLGTRRNIPLWETAYRNVFPRLGVSYTLDAKARTVLSGGVGLFGDLGGPAAGLVAANAPGSFTSLTTENVLLPLSSDAVRGIEETNLDPPYLGSVFVVDPNLATPTTLQWNASIQRAITDRHHVSASVVGAEGRRLIETRQFPAGVNPDFTETLYAMTTGGRSSYRALQLQYRTRPGWRLEGVASYTLGESRDTASTLYTASSELEPSENDVRHSFNVALSLQVPELAHGTLATITRDWAVHLIATARSAYPFTVLSSWDPIDVPGIGHVQQRASLLPGVPVNIEDPTAPGGRRYNRAAFTNPPLGEQGNTGRNAFRAYPAYQVDLGLQRSIELARGAKVRIRVDAFNVLNTPTFSGPIGDLTSPLFGIPLAMAASGSGEASLYRAGGPRSVATSVRLEF